MEPLRKISGLDMARLSDEEFQNIRKDAVEAARQFSHETRHQVVMQFMVLRRAIEKYNYGREEVEKYADRIIDIYHSAMSKREAALEDFVATVTVWFEESRPPRS